MGQRYNTDVLYDNTYCGKKIRDRIDKIAAASLEIGVPVCSEKPKTVEHIKVDADKCTGCGICYHLCPTGSYELIDGKADWATYGMKYCGECGTCRYVCPVNAITWNYPEGGTGIINKWS